MIVTSRLANDRLWAEALDLGAWDVLSKPFNRSEVLYSIAGAGVHWYDQIQVPAASMKIIGKLSAMILAMVNLLLRCRHRQTTRPMTPAHKARPTPGMTYVVCLDRGQQFHYDLAKMRRGQAIPNSAKSFYARAFQK